MSEQNPIRLFVTHLFTDHPDYNRVFEYLESTSNFFYTNCSDPSRLLATGGKEAIREALLAQIRAAEIIIVVSSMYSENRDLIAYQMDAAQAAGIPIIALDQFGKAGRLPAEVKARAAAVVEWNDRLMTDAIRLHARHEDTKRWEVIEFDMS